MELQDHDNDPSSRIIWYDLRVLHLKMDVHSRQFKMIEHHLKMISLPHPILSIVEYDITISKCGVFWVQFRSSIEGEKIGYTR